MHLDIDAFGTPDIDDFGEVQELQQKSIMSLREHWWRGSMERLYKKTVVEFCCKTKEKTIAVNGGRCSIKQGFVKIVEIMIFLYIN